MRQIVFHRKAPEVGEGFFAHAIISSRLESVSLFFGSDAVWGTL
jgi:hypothetical protein